MTGKYNNPANRGQQRRRPRRTKFFASRSTPPTNEEIMRLQDGYAARMDQHARRIANAERRLAAAELQATAAGEAVAQRTATASEKVWIAELWAAVELRREELEEYKRMALASPASAEHRGKKSFRPVPTRYESGI
jgi:hypothetical protein